MAVKPGKAWIPDERCDPAGVLDASSDAAPEVAGGARC